MDCVFMAEALPCILSEDMNAEPIIEKTDLEYHDEIPEPEEVARPKPF